MDLKIRSYKSRWKFNLWYVFLVIGVSSSLVNSRRITQKCPMGHYYTDGCTACWCDTGTGHTKCERLQRCAGVQKGNEKCPRGRQFKDNCGNDCTCYESTGAIFCNEKRKCHPEIPQGLVPVKIQTIAGVIDVNSDVFQRRGGLPAPDSPRDRDVRFSSSRDRDVRFSSPRDRETDRFPPPRDSERERFPPPRDRDTRFRDRDRDFNKPPPPKDRNDRNQNRPPSAQRSTTPPSASRRFSPVSPSLPSGSFSTRRYDIFDGLSVSSTPTPQIRFPSRGRSDELIIEPAIIVRQKGSNKASIVRNPSSATSVSLSSRRRNPGRGSFFRSGSKYRNSYTSEKPPSGKSSHLTPLLLYEKQLKAIMDIKKAYAKILGSKVNFNFQLATGQVGNPTVTVQQTQPQKPPTNNGLLFIQNRADGSTTDHPRRFDADYENSTILFNNSPTVSSTPSPILMTSQQPKPLLSLGTPFFWQKDLIKNTLKQFSPVPPLQQLVSYVTTSTENYLSQFLSNLGNRNNQLYISPETTTIRPVPPPPPSPNLMPSAQSFPTFAPPNTLPPPQPQPTLPSYPQTQSPYPQMHSTYSQIQSSYPQMQSTYTEMQSSYPQTMEPQYELQQNQFQQEYQPQQQQNSYQKPAPTFQPTETTPSLQHYQGNNVAYDNPSYQSPNYQFNNNYFSPPPPSPPQRAETSPQFPFMNELMQELAREDHGVPTATPRMSPAVPTFQTPGPPYVKSDVVRPLSFLPPPRPEPATPTRRIFNSIANMGRHPPNFFSHPRQSRPTVRVNLDKPIYVPPPPPNHQHQQHHQQHYPRPPPPPPPHRTYHPHPFFFPMLHQQNRRVYTRPHPVPPPPPPQLHYAPPPPRFNPQPEYFMPKPKQYRLVLKGAMRDAAVRVDDTVPNFVQKIAQEFFNKPEIYVPKIRPGKPLTLEKVILNHREIVPQEMMFNPTTPGSVAPPMTKLRFTPEAQWEMKEDLAKHGIMIDEPLTNPIRDYALNDPNVMEMDSPVQSIQTWETHTGMGMGTMPDLPSSPTPGMHPSTGSSSGLQSQMQQFQHPTSLPPPPSPSPQQIMPTMTPGQQQQQQDQIQQQLQHQILVAHHNHQLNAASSGSHNDNDNRFTIDPNDFNDFGQNQQQNQQHIFPPEVNMPGVQQVIVDKFIIHDPMDPVNPIKTYSTTTVQPSTTTIDNRVDLAPILNPHRTGLAQLPNQNPTQAPSVLIRHHGAPSSTTLSTPPMSPSPPFPTSVSHPSGNILMTVINSTPHPQLVTTTISPLNVDSLPPTMRIVNSASDQSESIAGQIHDFLTDQMDFGARPDMDLFEVLFNSKTEAPPIMSTFAPTSAYFRDNSEDQLAAESRSGEGNDDKDNEKEKEKEVETEQVASIFSYDYKSKYNRKPPEVIVIKVPPDHSDGPFPKVVEKRKGAEIEIVGGPLNHNKKDDESDESKMSTENSVGTSTKRSVESSSEKSEETSTEKETSSSKKRKSQRKRKRRRKKGKRRNKDRDREEEEEREEDEEYDEDRKVKKKSNSNEKIGNISAAENGKSEENSETEKDSKTEKTVSVKENANNGTTLGNQEAENKFKEELDWKQKLMANICQLNPSSPLCLTYRSICLLMSSDD